jgi:trehalose 6-phosphate synthase/phosphatase
MLSSPPDRSSLKEQLQAAAAAGAKGEHPSSHGQERAKSNTTGAASRMNPQAEYVQAEAMELIERINSTYPGSVDYSDYACGIHVMPQADRMAVWLTCDVYFNTSLREGLNLWPLEYVYTRQQYHGVKPGVAILSEYTIASKILNGAIRTNPHNMDDICASLDRALGMDDSDKSLRHARDLPYVMNKTSAKWAEQVLADLSRAIQYRLRGVEEFTDFDGLAFGGTQNIRDFGAGGMSLGAHVTIGKGSGFAPMEQGKILRAYLQSKRRLLVFDYGGTLKGIESMNKEYKVNTKQVTGTRPSDRLLAALHKLASDVKHNDVLVVSGVPTERLQRSIGHIPELGLVAENGLFYSPSVARGGKLSYGRSHRGKDNITICGSQSRFNNLRI